MLKTFISQPVKPFKISQFFGENQICIDLATGTKCIPCDGLNPPKGYKSVYSQMRGHNGLDIIAKRWQGVYSSTDGIVTEVCTEQARGLGVGVTTTEKFFCQETDREEYFTLRYWHHIANNVHVGDKILTGDLLGYADSTGFSSGDHLHLELKPVAIMKYKDGVPVTKVLLPNNGYFGAVDPKPYLDTLFAVDNAGLVKRLRELSALVADYVADKLRYGKRSKEKLIIK